MADHSINFRIGSSTTGDGFKQTFRDVKTMVSAVRNASSTIGAMAGAFGAMDTSCSKALSAVAGLMSALSSGNPVIIGMSLALTGISGLVGHFNAEIEKTTKKAEDLKKACKDAFEQSLTDAVSSAIEEADGLTKRFDAVAKSADRMVAALNSLQSSKSAGNLVNLEIEQFNAMLAEATEEGRDMIASEYALKMANERLAAANDEKLAKDEAAHNAVIEAERRYELTQKAIADLNEERADLVEAMNDDELESTKVKQQLKNIDDKKVELESRLVSLTEDIKVARIKEQNVSEQTTTAVNKYKLEVLKATDATRKLAEEQAAAEDALERKGEEEWTKALTEDLNDALKAQTDSKRALVAAESAYKAALETWSKYLSSNAVLATGMGNALTAGGSASMGALAAGTAVDQWRSNYKSTDPLAYNSANQAAIEKQAARAARDAAHSADANRVRQDDFKYNRLRNRSESSLSDADKKFMDDYAANKEARERQGEDLKSAKEALEVAQKNDAEMGNNVKAIRDKLEELGLK